jgi:hypothetical protein
MSEFPRDRVSSNFRLSESGSLLVHRPFFRPSPGGCTP